MRASRRTLSLAGLVLALSTGVQGSTTPSDLQVCTEVVVNPVGSASYVAFEACEKAGSAQQWWMMSRVPRGSDGMQLTCGSGPFPDNPQEEPSPVATPYLIATGSITAGLQPATLTPERTLLLNLSHKIRKLAGAEVASKPLYQESTAQRTYYFEEGGFVVSPLLVADKEEMEKYGIREVFLKVTAGTFGKTGDYGTITVISDLVEAELLLDGGVVGRIVSGVPVVLRNVRPGLRIVSALEPTGAKIRKIVRVRGGRKVVVNLQAAEKSGQDPYELMPLGENAKGYEEYRRQRDGAVMVKIPAGEFLMGNRETERSPLEHKVFVSSFMMDKLGVTWGQYEIFAAETGIPLPPRHPYWGMHDDHPAVFVTWEEARSYCQWAGGRLPTEAEREKAARGTDGRKYPWGNEEPSPERGVYRSEWGYAATQPVGTHPAGMSPYGLLDMGGNVWEWCSDWYDENYYRVSPYRNPKGPSSGSAHVVRGGSWDSRPSVLSSSCRNFGHRGYRELDFGFRCAMNAPVRVD